MTDFAIHPILEKDTAAVTDWPASRILLWNDSNYPWLVVVPRLPETRDLDELSAPDLIAVMDEVAEASRRLKQLAAAEKMNVAALGNSCPQLHFHVIARYSNDAAWPGPVWGKLPPKPYGEAEREAFLAELKAALAL